jgi:hypothetical protein
MLVGFEPVLIDGDTFNLLVRCSRSRFELPIFIYFKLHGEILPAQNGSKINFQMQSHGPISMSDWLFQIFWVFILFLSLAGSIIGIVNSSTPQTYILGFMLALAGFVYLGIFIQTFRLGKTHIPKLLYQSLREKETTSSNDLNSKSTEWLSELMDSS